MKYLIISSALLLMLSCKDNSKSTNTQQISTDSIIENLSSKEAASTESGESPVTNKDVSPLSYKIVGLEPTENPSRAALRVRAVCDTKNATEEKLKATLEDIYNNVVLKYKEFKYHSSIKYATIWLYDKKADYFEANWRAMLMHTPEKHDISYSDPELDAMIENMRKKK
jgi:hypothetical protein